MITNLYHPRLQKDQYVPDFRYYYYRIFDKPYNMAPHSHPQIEIMYVEQGGCHIIAEGEELRLGRNEFILINGDVPHGMVVAEKESCRVLNIEFFFAPGEGELFSVAELIAKIKKVPAVLQANKNCLILRDTEEVGAILRRMVHELETRSPYSEPLLGTLFWQLILSISQLMEETDGKESTGSLGHYYIKKAVRYMNNNYYRNIDVDDIAGYLNINRSYFHRIFKDIMGCTPVEYLTGVRMEHAKVLLARTELSILDISRNIGLQSQQYFNYVFKKHIGMSPGSFRKQYQINELK